MNIKGLKFPKFDRKIVQYGVTTKYILTLKESDKELFKNLEPLFNDLNRLVDDNYSYSKHEIPTQFVGVAICKTAFDDYDAEIGVKIAKEKAYKKAETWFYDYIFRIIQLDNKFNLIIENQFTKYFEDKEEDKN